MLIRLVPILLLVNGLLANERAESLDNLAEITKKWVEVEKKRSDEKNDGEYQITLLKQLEDVLKEQIVDWREKVKKLENEMSQSDKQREAYIEQLKSFEKSKQVTQSILEKISRKLKAIRTFLPKPLLKETELEYRILYAKKGDRLWLDQAKSSLTILKQIHQFSRKYSHVSQDIQLDGKTISAKVLYIGLHSAVFLTLDEKQAGIGKPSEKGWLWEKQSERLSDVKQALEIMKGSTVNLRVVNLEIKKG